MLPARKKRKVVVKRQYPLLRSHGGVVAAQSSEGTDWSRLPHLVSQSSGISHLLSMASYMCMYVCTYVCMYVYGDP